MSRVTSIIIIRVSLISTLTIIMGSKRVATIYHKSMTIVATTMIRKLKLNCKIKQ